MISVALAYYNGGKYIEEQIGSILPQLDDGDELIISIDGAWDGSMDILEYWAAKDSRIRLITGPGKGVVRNFENALYACRGDVIFLSDQDDIWEKYKVKAVMKAMEQPDCLAVLHNAITIDENGKPDGGKDLFTWRISRTGIFKNIMRNSYVGCCMALKKELLEIVLPIPERIYMHDYWIGTAAEFCGRVILIKKPLIRYRRHSGNVTDMHPGPLRFMVKKRFDILISLFILERRRRLLWKKK